MNDHPPRSGAQRVETSPGEESLPGGSTDTTRVVREPPRYETGRSLTTDRPFRAELHYRGDSFGGFGGREAATRVRQLAASGVLSDSTVIGEWPRCQTRGEGMYSAALTTYERFQTWGETTGFSLAPAFQERPRSFIGIGEIEEVVVFPVVALALYDDEELRAVFPCTDGERTYTVERALTALERGEQDWFARFDPESAEHTELPVHPNSMTPI